MANSEVNIGKPRLKNPVMTASGTFGYGVEFADFINLNDLGGIIVKGTTPPSARRQRLSAHGRNPVGNAQLRGDCKNKGYVDYFCENIYPLIKD